MGQRQHFWGGVGLNPVDNVVNTFASVVGWPISLPLLLDSMLPFVGGTTGRALDMSLMSVPSSLKVVVTFKCVCCVV